MCPMRSSGSRAPHTGRWLNLGKASLMGLAARNDRWDWILKLLGRRLVALASPSRLGDAFLEEIHDVVWQV